MGIWRNEIISEDSLGTNELFLNWDEYACNTITAITFSADGDMYIGTDMGDAITVLQNGNLRPFYKEILYPPTKAFCWGNGKYLYVIRLASDVATRRVIRINMFKDGAPYYGRQ